MGLNTCSQTDVWLHEGYHAEEKDAERRLTQGAESMNTQTTNEARQMTDAVERALLLATCLWGGQCYEPCPHHRASADEVKEALVWLETHPAEVRAWEERRAAGLPALGLLVGGHVGQVDGPFWECEACGFRFDAVHADPAGGHTCPNCEATLLRQLLGSLVGAIQHNEYPLARVAIIKERLRMWDATAGSTDNSLDRIATTP
jgi:rubrerythrin